MTATAWIRAEGQPPVLQNRADWPLLKRHDTNDAPPCGIDGDTAILARWIRTIGPIETSDIQGIERGMHALLNHNADAVNAGRRWLAINGPSLVGKTQSTTAAMLRGESPREWWKSVRP